MQTLAVFAVASTAILATLTTVTAQTGRCHSAKEIVEAKSWEAINYKYSPAYIEEHRADFEAAVKGGSDVFFNDCQANNLSDEQIILQGALDIAAIPVKGVADTLLKGLGLPETGEKAFHIDIKDIEKHGIFGGPESVFRKPFG